MELSRIEEVSIEDQVSQQNFLSYSDLRSNASVDRPSFANDEVTHNNQTDCESGVQDENEPELDGGFGWVVVFGCFLIEGFVFGTIRCFSIFLIHFQDEFQVSSNLVSWIPSICLALLHASGIIAGHLSMKFGARVVVIFGGIMISMGFLIGSFADSIIQVYFGVGFATGLGFGLAYIPSNVILGRYFNKRRALAYCITSTGGPVASFVFAPFFQYLVDNYTLKMTLFILSITMIAVPLCGVVLTSPKATSRNVNHSKAVKRVSRLKPSYQSTSEFDNPGFCADNISEERGGKSSSLPGEGKYQEEPRLSVAPAQKRNRIPRRKTFPGLGNTSEFTKSRRHDPKWEVWKKHIQWKSLSKDQIKQQLVGNKDTEAQMNDCIDASDENTKQEEKPKCDEFAHKGLQWGLLKQCPFVTYCLVGLCIGAGAFTPNVFFVPHAISRGFKSYDSALLVSAMGGVSVISSLASGWVTTLTPAIMLYFDVVSLFLLGLSCLLCPLATTYAQLAGFCVTFGIFLGAVMALPFSVLVEIVGPECLYSGFAFFMMVTSVAVFITPPTAGWLVDVTGNYDAIFYLSGAALILGSFGVLLIALGTEVIPDKTVEASDRVIEISQQQGEPSFVIGTPEVKPNAMRLRMRRQSILHSGAGNRCGTGLTDFSPAPVRISPMLRRKSMF